MSLFTALMENIEQILKADNEPSKNKSPKVVVHPEKMIEESEATSLPALDALEAEGFVTFEPSRRDDTVGQDVNQPISPAMPQEPTSSRFRGLLGRRKKKKVIRRLFNGDAAQYEAFLATLSKARDWTEASLHVDSMFIKNGVDPYSKTAMMFTEVVQRAFLTQERSVK